MSTQPTKVLLTSRSVRTSAALFRVVDLIGQAQEPTATQLQALDSAYKGTGDFLAECPEFDGTLLEVHGHGSRQLGTLIRPIDPSRDGYDIDLIARLGRHAVSRYSGPNGPAALLTVLQTTVKRYADRHGLKMQRCDRCVTLEYAGGMCADIAPVIDDPLIVGIYASTHGRIPDRSLKSYQATNPRGYAAHFASIAAIAPVFTEPDEFTKALKTEARADVTPLPSSVEVFARLLSRFVQVVKLNRNVAFAAEGVQQLKPSSIFLTTLVMKAYEALARVPHDTPLDLLLDVVQSLPLFFQRERSSDGVEYWSLANPSAPSENLADSMNDAQKQAAFTRWHYELKLKLARMVDVIENRRGMDELIKAVEEAFGARASAALLADQSRLRAQDRSQGLIAVTPALGATRVLPSRAHTFYGD